MKTPEEILKINLVKIGRSPEYIDEMIKSDDEYKAVLKSMDEHSSQFTSQIEELIKEVERLKAEKQRVFDLAKANVKWHRNRNHELKEENDRYREALEGIEADILANEHDWCRNPQAMFNKFKSLHPLVKEGE